MKLRLAQLSATLMKKNCWLGAREPFQATKTFYLKQELT